MFEAENGLKQVFGVPSPPISCPWVGADWMDSPRSMEALVPDLGLGSPHFWDSRDLFAGMLESSAKLVAGLTSVGLLTLPATGIQFVGLPLIWYIIWSDAIYTGPPT